MKRPSLRLGWAGLGLLGVALTGVLLLSLQRPPGPIGTESPEPLLAGASPFDHLVMVATPTASGPGSGTAFSVGANGVWLTARHVVEGCGRVVLVVAPGHGVLAQVRTYGVGETAVLITQGGSAPLSPEPPGDLRRHAWAYHLGYPGGRPGEATSRLIGRETLVEHGRRLSVVPVLVWSQQGASARTPANLAGISGAPALDDQGRVIGVTIAQAERQAHIITTTPHALRIALARAGVRTQPGLIGPATPINSQTYAAVANTMRKSLRIVPVACLAR